MGLIHDCAAGVCSAPHLWKHVEYSILDGRDEGLEPHPLLHRLFKCVSSDKDQNCHQRLMKLFLDECGFKFYITPIDRANSSVTALIKPTQIFGLIHGGDRGTFYRVMGAPKPILKKTGGAYFPHPTVPSISCYIQYVKIGQLNLCTTLYLAHCMRMRGPMRKANLQIR